jgi:Asp-tRNA(Asn)/Glu-tRNA(Gln) amidotransferase C subunit
MANRTRNILNALSRDKLQDEQTEQYSEESKAVIDYYEKQK